MFYRVCVLFIRDVKHRKFRRLKQRNFKWIKNKKIFFSIYIYKELHMNGRWIIIFRNQWGSIWQEMILKDIKLIIMRYLNRDWSRSRLMRSWRNWRRLILRNLWRYLSILKLIDNFYFVFLIIKYSYIFINCLFFIFV